jgi:hypothetical protein
MVLDFLKVKLWDFPKLDKAILAYKNKARLRESSNFVPRLCDNSCDVVIEGFPRSANTFFSYKLLMSTNYKIKIAHHMHTPSQFLFAKKANIKAVVLIREPLSAIVSYVTRKPSTSIELALKLYATFYEKAFKYQKDNVLVLDFADIISTDVVSKTLDFMEYKGKRLLINDEEVFKKIEERSSKLNKGLIENMVARPSKDENKIKFAKQVKQDLLSEKYGKGLEDCQKIYGKFK